LRARPPDTGLATTPANRYESGRIGAPAPGRRLTVAKGQMRKSKEARKPKKAKVKTIAANPQRSPLEHLKNN
jgi:hypothetical protein